MFQIYLVSLLIVSVTAGNPNTTRLRVLGPEDAKNLTETGRSFKVAAAKTTDIPPDRGGNYGDLIYRCREGGDGLLLRELVVIDELSSWALDLEWYGRVDARRISSVRVLNIGRERAYCYRIEVALREAWVYLRVPPRHDPRVLIEIYGF